MLSEILIILVLVLLNGAFAMAEMAVVASRRSRLEAEAEAGNRRAGRALRLAKEPSQFLSTVQIGITLIGILAGVYGGATIAGDLEVLITVYIPALRKYADPLSYGIVVIAITYLSLVIGELVPKRLALAFPERIAVGLMPLLRFTLFVFKPFVLLLGVSTRTVLKFLPVRLPDGQAVTEEDVQSLIEQSTEQGVLESDESTIVSRALRLGGRPVQSIMTPRIDLVWLDIEEQSEDIWSLVVSSPHNYYPVCRKNPEDFLGIVSVKDLAIWRMKEHRQPLIDLVKQPSTLHSGISVLHALRTFRRERRHSAVIIDEHGSIDGLVTTHDLLEAIVGELSDNPKEQLMVREREDGTLLVDGWLDIDDLADRLDLPHGSLAGDGSYRSVGGLIMWKLSSIPNEGDAVSIEGYRFKVMNMDRHRVDKVLIQKEPASLTESGPASEA